MRLTGIKHWHQQTKKVKKAIKAEQNRLRELIRELKQCPCADCGLQYPSEAMDFDHVPGRGGKLGTVPSRKSVRAILEEARKCDVVCSNCHRVRTRKRRVSARLVAREREQYISGLALAVERERQALRDLKQGA